MKKVTLFSDGSCLGNPGNGGWAFLLQYNNHEKLASGGEPDTTNNRMELMAVIKGLEHLKEPCEIRIITDSQYMMKAFTEGWLSKWKTNGWKTANKKPVKNQDLWQELDNLLETHKISWEWVKGHSGHPENERVDDAARAAAENLLTELPN